MLRQSTQDSHTADGGRRERIEWEVTLMLQSGWNPFASVLELRPFCILETL